MNSTNINDNSIFDKQTLARRLTELLDTYAVEIPTPNENTWDICKPTIKNLGNKPLYTVAVDPYKEKGGSITVFENSNGVFKFIKSEDI